MGVYGFLQGFTFRHPIRRRLKKAKPCILTSPLSRAKRT